MSTPTPTDRCPCDLGHPYAECCGRFHGDRSAVTASEPPDPVTLMRSRYAAFVKKRWDYVWRTLHPDHDDRRAHDFSSWSKTVKKNADVTRYLRLRILDTLPPDTEGVARVLFHVSVSRRRRDISFAERSLFLRTDEGWRYLAGEFIAGRLLPKPIESLDDATFESLLAQIG